MRAADAETLTRQLLQQQRQTMYTRADNEWRAADITRLQQEQRDREYWRRTVQESFVQPSAELRRSVSPYARRLTGEKIRTSSPARGARARAAVAASTPLLAHTQHVAPRALDTCNVVAATAAAGSPKSARPHIDPSTPKGSPTNASKVLRTPDQLAAEAVTLEVRRRALQRKMLAERHVCRGCHREGQPCPWRYLHGRLATTLQRFSGGADIEAALEAVLSSPARTRIPLPPPPSLLSRGRTPSASATRSTSVLGAGGREEMARMTVLANVQQTQQLLLQLRQTIVPEQVRAAAGGTTRARIASFGVAAVGTYSSQRSETIVDAGMHAGVDDIDATTSEAPLADFARSDVSLDGFSAHDRALLVRIAAHFDAVHAEPAPPPTPPRPLSGVHSKAPRLASQGKSGAARASSPEDAHWTRVLHSYSLSRDPHFRGAAATRARIAAALVVTNSSLGTTRSHPTLPSVPLVRNAVAGKKPTLTSLVRDLDLE